MNTRMSRNRETLVGLVALVIGVFSALPASATITPAGVFSDSMVLQRGLRVPVWGWATAGEQITVVFNGQTVTATAHDSSLTAYKGYWKAWLSSMTAGGPYDMTITGSSSPAVTLKNLLVGDVWLCSGQSNMWYSFAGMYFADNTPEMQTLPPSGSPITQIRMCQVGTSWSTNPALDIQPANEWTNQDQKVTAPWRSCSREAGQQFSACGGIFGIEIYRDVNVPIGLITASVGATSIKEYVTAELSDTIVWRQCGNKPDTAIQTRLPVRFGGGANSATDGGVFSGELYPLIGFGIKGVIWWQGENEAEGLDPVCYYTSGGFRQLIRSWRRLWAEGNFPFIYIQLHQQLDTYNAAINDVRDQQVQALQEPNTGMSSIFDSCYMTHPGKYVAASRLALAAREVAYGENIEGMGPIYKSMAIEGSTIRISFAHVGGGLIKKDLVWFEGTNPATGANVLSSSSDATASFQIAGADNVFHPADAVLSTNNTVVVSAPSVSAPKNVRYAIEANGKAETPLYNTANLTASMFRTDTWSGLGNTQTILNGGSQLRREGTIAVARAFKVLDGRIVLPEGAAGRAGTVAVYDVRGALIGRLAVEAGGVVRLGRNVCNNQVVVARVQ